jgi:hypothetical protein
MLLAALALGIAALACGKARPAGREADPLWVKEAQPAGFGKFSQYSPVYAGGYFFALADNDILYAWDELTGAVVWQDPAVSFRLSADGQSLFAQQPDMICNRLALADAAILERMPDSHLCLAWRRHDGEAVYSFGDDDHLTATRPLTGEVLWQVPLNLPPAVSESVFNQEPGTDDDLLEAQGRVLVHTVSFAPGDSYSEYFNFQAFDAATGALVWQVVGKSYGRVIYDAARVYLIYGEGFAERDNMGRVTVPLNIHAHDIASGAELWQAAWAGQDFHTLSDGVLYGCLAGNWQLLDAASGREVAQYAFALEGYSTLCPSMNNAARDTLARGTLFVQGGRVSAGYEFEFTGRLQDTWLNAYDLAGGDTLWSTDILIEKPVTIAAVGREVILLWWDGALRAYGINR